MLTRLALSQAARELTEVSLSLVPTWGEDDLTPGSYTRVMRRTGALFKRVRVMAILCDRIVLAAPWDEIDRHLGTPPGEARSIFEAMEVRWRDGDPAPWAPVFDAVDVAPEVAALVDRNPVDVSDPQALAAELDRFCVRHIPAGGGDSSPVEHLRQVSNGLPKWRSPGEAGR